MARRKLAAVFTFARGGQYERGGGGEGHTFLKIFPTSGASLLNASMKRTCQMELRQTGVTAERG